jgi:2-dehydro-3-deoxygalactonokinase
MKGAFIAVDWGTTNRRAYLMEEGRVTRMERDARGILTVAADDFGKEAQGIRARLGDLPLLCIGMIGSRRGWREVPYVQSPASFEGLAAGTVWVEPGRAAITPGVSFKAADRCDVMRGEEIQFLGAKAAALAPDGALLCQPGTHSKWVRLENGCIKENSTALTGELFSLLKEHSLLKEVLTGEVRMNAAFLEGVREGGKQRLLSSLFGARAAHLLSVRAASDGAAYVSGLLIGSDVQSHLPNQGEVHIIGDAPLAPLYAAAVSQFGGRAHLIDSSAAFVAGATRLWNLLS